MSKPTVAELQEILHDLVEWELFAIHFRGFNEIEIEKIKKEFKNAPLEEQKLYLYSRWLTLCPDATWNDVVCALEKGKETRLAEKVKNEKIENAKKPKGKQVTFSFTEKDEEELIKELEEIDDSFTILLKDVRKAIEKIVAKNSLQEIIEDILDAKIEGLESLSKCQTTSEVVGILRKNCSFLDGSILNRIVKYGFPQINAELKSRTREHMEKVKAFKSKAPLKLFKETLKKEIEVDSTQTTLVVKLNNDWDKVTFNHVEELILALAGIHAKVVRVKNGSVEIMFMISRDKVMCFNITAQKRQLMCLIGVLYLQVGDERLFKGVVENTNNTFENGLLEAGKVGHIQATEFILNMNIVNINHQDNDEGRTALMLASEHGHIEVLKLILSAGANVNIQDNIGQTAVMVAKTVEIYQTLVQANADTSITTHEGSTPLIVSCLLGNHEVANHLLFTLNHEITTRPDGMTLLMAASQGGNQRIAEHLLTNEADPNVQNNYGVTAIELSCLFGHYTVTQILLKHNADPNITDKGRTPLMAASLEGHHEIVQMLLVQGKVDPNVTDFYGQTALMQASQNGHLKTVELLLSNGADPNIQNEDSGIAIHSSICGGHYIMTKLLLKHNANPNTPDKFGCTPLMIASRKGYHEIVHLLLVQEGVDPNKTDYDGLTALMLASQNEYIETVEVLLSNRADPNIQDNNGKTTIWLSCFNGHYAVTETFLKHNADPNISDNDGCTPLMAASHQGHHEIAQMLLVQEKVDPNITNTNGRTALMQASQNGHTETVELLLSNGADPNIQDKDGIRAICLSCYNGHYVATQILLKHKADPRGGWQAPSVMVASQEGHHKIVQMLLVQKRVDPNVTNINGLTALTQASCNGHTETVELLLSNGADPNIQDNNGTTAIWLSCCNGHYIVTKILLKHSADPNISDIHGQMPLLIASQEGHHNIVQMLLTQEKVDPNITDNSGQTPLMQASQNGHAETVELLLLNGADPNIQDNNYRITAICLSCFNGHYKVTEILLKHNADPNTTILVQEKENPNMTANRHALSIGLTPLMIASLQGHDKIVELLLQQGGVDPNTGITIACNCNQYHIVSILLKAGADPLHVDDNFKGRDPLTATIKNTQSCEMLELLQSYLNEAETQKFCLKGVFISQSLMNHSLVNYFMSRISSLPDTIDTVVQHYDRQDMVSLKQLSQQENIGGQWLEQNTASKQPLKEEIDKILAMTWDLLAPTVACYNC